MPMIRKPTPLLASFKAGAKELDGAQCRVGWFESAKYKDGTPVAYVAAIQEFGSEQQGIPARATMRPTMAKDGAEWSRQIGFGATAVVKGRLTADQVFDQVGGDAAGAIREAISNLTEPELSDATLAARRKRGNSSTKPLVDTSIMVDTVTHSLDRGQQP